MSSDQFAQAIYEMAQSCHNNAVSHGFYNPVPSVPERLMLMVSELSEALEEYRNGRPPVYIGDNGKPEGLGVELADCVIRILDTCAEQGIDIGRLIVEKHEYNKTRPYRHGGKVI